MTCLSIGLVQDCLVDEMATQLHNYGDFTNWLVHLIVKDLAFICNQCLMSSLAQARMYLHFAYAKGADSDFKVASIQNPEQLYQILIQDAVQVVEFVHCWLLEAAPLLASFLC